MSFIPESEILNLVRAGHRWIDVRAPNEFAEGTIPNSINLPLLNDEERRQVGTCYKTQGREIAIQLGHQLVSGANKLRKVQSWIDETKKHPNISLYCFRGGMRSGITQTWLKDVGIDIQRVDGGFKQMRFLLTQYFIDKIEKANIQIISGPTGSWKTHLIQWLEFEKHLAIDLEKLSNHRGSAFGKLGPQPNQINFEHSIVKEILNKEEKFNNQSPVFIEDESRLIGRCMLPEFLFAKMRASPILWIDEPIQTRVENIYHDYVMETAIVKSKNEVLIKGVYQGYSESLSGIKKRLGIQKYSEIYKDIRSAEHLSLTQDNHDSNRVWIKKLLECYYDPLYFSSLERRNPVTLIKARTEEIKSFISQ